METLHVPVLSSTGEPRGTQQLDPQVFGVPFKDPLVYQVVKAHMANKRTVLAHTKGRGEVRGGGKKPWRQKGTGRARHGSRRSPLWAGGGITFGPTKERNFAQKINKKMRQQALRMVLSDRVSNEKLVVIEDWKLEDAKTKRLAALLGKLPGARRTTMLITSPEDRFVIRAAMNLPKVQSIGVGSLNVLDLLKYEYLVVPQKLIQVIEQRYRG